MSTVLQTSQSPADQETSAGREVPRKSAVIVHHRLSHMALGTIVAVAKSFADSVYVVLEREDARTSSLARSLGAGVIYADKDAGQLCAALAGAGVVVAMYGDGTHDPYLIPELIYHATDGHDVAVGPATAARGQDETVRLLNRRRLATDDASFVASSYRAVRGLKPRGGQDLSRQILEHAAHLGASIKYLGASQDWLSGYRIGVVVPAYNEEPLLGETVSGIPEYVSRIYVIDDGSTDRTPEVIRGLEDPRVSALRHDVNRGVGASIVDGYRMALRDGMDLVAVMAGDNQMDPAQLPRLLLPVIDGRADYAKGNRLLSRHTRKGMSTWRLFGNSMLTLLNKIASGYWQISDPQNGYTVISRRALELLDLDAIYTYYGYCNDLLVKLNMSGLRTVDVAMPARYGKERSHIRYSRFIVKVSPMLFRSFLQRLRVKYTILDFHPLVLFYVSSMALLPAGLLLGAVAIGLALFGVGASVPLGLLAALATIAGLQFLFSAMALDWGVDRLGRGGPGR